MLNAKAIVGAYLREHPDVEALGARVVGKTPAESDRDEPWARITRLDASNRTGTREVEHFIAFWLQFESYAGETGGWPEANAVNDAVRGALVAITGADLEGAVATDIEFLSNPEIADADMKPARERIVLDAELYMHPKP